MTSQHCHTDLNSENVQFDLQAFYAYSVPGAGHIEMKKDSSVPKVLSEL